MVICTTAYGETCDLAPEALNRYEQEILRAAESHNYKAVAAPLACIMQMQSENEGIARYLASSYLRPLLGGVQVPGLENDRRYKVIAKLLEQLTLRNTDALQRSFVTEFSRGDWRFYTLFCEQGNTDFCSVFLPDENRINAESPLMAAASMMRLRKAYQVLNGKQRDLIGQRLKNLYRDIPRTALLKRKFIEQIYTELFQFDMPMAIGTRFPFQKRCIA